MKKFVMGFVSASILFCGVSFADEIKTLQVSVMNCGLIADNKEVIMDEPILNYSGKAYVPLRKVSELSNATINWNNDTKIINITSNTKETIKEVPVEKIVTKEVIKEVPKEVIKEVNNAPQGAYGKLIIGYTDNNYMLMDTDSNGTGNIFVLNPNGMLFGKYNKNILNSPIVFGTNPVKENTTTQATSTSAIIGPLKIYSSDSSKVYLGTLSSNEYDSESIFNTYGTYGSKYSLNSIWNEYGTYGSKYSLYSAFNDYTTSAPIIVDSKYNVVGRLTTNKYVAGAINPYESKSLATKLGY